MCKLLDYKIIAIARGIDEAHIIPTIQALIDGGIKAVELPLSHSSKESYKETLNIIKKTHDTFGDKIYLGELVENTKSAVKAKFSYEDVSLSGGFKKAFAKNIASGGNTIEYLKSTAIITTSAGLKIYLPNQWFVLATYPVELIKEIIKYRNYTEKVIDSNVSVFVGSNGKALEKKEIYKNLKSTDGIDFSEKFKQIMKDYLLDLGQQEDIANQNCELLYKFVSNDKWWLGGKGIERTNDFYVSPILSVLNLVNASQSYVATITYAYVNDANLYAELETITDADEEGSDSFEDEIYYYDRGARKIMKWKKVVSKVTLPASCVERQRR